MKHIFLEKYADAYKNCLFLQAEPKNGAKKQEKERNRESRSKICVGFLPSLSICDVCLFGKRFFCFCVFYDKKQVKAVDEAWCAVRIFLFFQENNEFSSDMAKYGNSEFCSGYLCLFFNNFEYLICKNYER